MHQDCYVSSWYKLYQYHSPLSSLACSWRQTVSSRHLVVGQFAKEPLEPSRTASVRKLRREGRVSLLGLGAPNDVSAVTEPGRRSLPASVSGDLEQADPLPGAWRR